MVPPILKQNENILSLHTHLQLLFHFIPPLLSKNTQLFIFYYKRSFLLHPHYLHNLLCPHDFTNGSLSNSQNPLCWPVQWLLLCLHLIPPPVSIQFNFSLPPSWQALSWASVIPHPLISLVVFPPISFSSYSFSACSLNVGKSLGLVRSLLPSPPPSVFSA